MNQSDTIGLIPAAGKARRLGSLPFSKELYPVGFENDNERLVSKVISSYLIDHFNDAGIHDVHFVIKDGKWDIPSFYHKRNQHQLNFAYHIADVDYGVPFSLNKAYPFIKGKKVCLGFPDILFRPKNAYQQLLSRLHSNPAVSVVLGVMPINRPEKWDMIEFDEKNRIKRILIKSEEGKKMKYGWTIAAWNPDFSEYLNSFVTKKLVSKTEEELSQNELHVGDVVRSAINAGKNVESVIFEDGECIDIGTPEDLKSANSFF